jgi:uroporphyrinogen-III synthase
VTDEIPLIRRIAVTRASGQNESLRAEIQAVFGTSVQVIELPCVEFREPENSTALDSAIRSISNFAWILFTSQNAARYFARRMRALGVAPDAPGKLLPRIAAIGPATAEAASAEGFTVEFVPRPGTGRDFASSFKESVRAAAGMESRNPTAGFLRSVAGMKILVPRSDLALRDRGAADWTEVLQEAGAEVTCVEAYQTRAPENLGALLTEVLRDSVDCFVFSSPSAFQNFVRAAGADNVQRLARESVFAAIGPTTAAAIHTAGFVCAIESTEPDVKLLTEAIASYLKSIGHRRTQSASTQGANWA